ncbi:MAG TPA: VWA domain-containing protein [Planctomycetota bacterium]|nr:VWA domain-containing protein [Planctomycetota bacterium]
MPLNPSILIWMALAGAPVVIHLLNRRRYRVINWGAMQFLEQSVAKSSRRLLIEQLLILMLRTLLIAFIVYAMARPYLPGAMPVMPAARPKRNVVVLLDRSMSMRYDENRVANLAQGKEAVARIIGELQKGDSLNIVLAGGRPQPLLKEPVVDIEQFMDLLREVEPMGDEANMTEAIKEALAQLEKSYNPLREIYIITDRQAFGWQAKTETRWADTVESLERGALKPTLHVLQVGQAEYENAAVTGITPAHSSVGIYQPARFDVRITNFGKERREKVNVRFTTGDSREKTTQVDLASGGNSVSVSFEHQFDTPGSQLVRVSIDPDALPADDEMVASVDVYDAIPVLLIDGTGSSDAQTPGALELALRPRDSENPDFKSLLAVQVCRIDTMPSLSTSKFHLVVMHDVARVPDRQVAELERFVFSGGGLLVMPGRNSDPASFNRYLYRDGDGLLPSKLEQVPALKDPVRALAQAFTHPALAQFRDPKNGDFTLIEVYKYFRYVDPRDGKSRVLAQLGNSDPLFIEKTFGQGRVILSAVPVDKGWTNLQKRSFFLPLMQCTAYYLAGSVQPPRNVLLGSPLSLFLPPESRSRTVQVIDPEENEHEVKVAEKDGRRVATFTDTQKPGTYRMLDGDGKQTFYVVRPPEQESNIKPLNPDEIAWVEKTLGATFAKDWDDLRVRAFSKTRELREFWQLLIIAAILVLLLETLLTGRFAARSQRIEAARA